MFLERWYFPLSFLFSLSYLWDPRDTCCKSFIFSQKSLCGWVARKGHPPIFPVSFPETSGFPARGPLSPCSSHLHGTQSNQTQKRTEQRHIGICASTCVCRIFSSLCDLFFPVTLCPQDTAGMRSCPYGTYNPPGAAQIKWKTVCFCLSLSMEGQQEKLRHMTIALKDWPLS